jgi:glucosamine--fructose-6-phosphate aminotransferase (isomerizing)
VIGISQSGASPDIVAVLTAARRQGAITLAITNDPDSPLARAAAACFPLHADEERAVAATKTYTNELLALAMLSAALNKDDRENPWDELAGLADRVEAAIRLNGDLGPQARPFQPAERMVVVGRGYNYATAFEVALKIQETAYVMAEAYSPADFLHGPVAIMEPGMPIMVVAPFSRVSEELDTLLALARERGAQLIAISDRDEVLGQAAVGLRLPTGTPEWLSPMVAVIPGQLWAQALAVARGRHPDTPRGLSKVTHTR